MDKEFKQGVEQLAQAQRLQEEEALHAENISRTIEYSEEIEEKEYLITKLQKKIKVTWGIAIAGIMVLVIILLYMIYTGMKPESTPTPVPTPIVTEEPTVTPTPQPVKTNITSKGVVYHLSLPEITMDGVDSTTIGAIKDWVDDGTYGEKEFYYLDNHYFTGYQFFDLNKSTVLYELEDIKHKLSEVPRVYEMEVLENPDTVFNSNLDSMGAMMYLGCGTQTLEGDVVLYYNEEYLNYLGESVLGAEDCIFGHQYIPFTVTLFNEDAVSGVEAAIQQVLEDYNYMLYEFDYTSSLPDDFRTKVYEAVIAVEPKVNINDYSCTYNYYDDIVEENGQLTGIHEGEQEGLTEKITLRITVDDLIYNLYGYLYHNGLY